MTKPPAFQFYVGDWVLSTRTIPIEARGLHIDLLAYAWDNGGLPADLSELHAFVGIGRRRFETLWAKIADRWESDGNGCLINPRQEEERQKQQRWREKSAKGGRASAQARGNQ